MAEMSSNNSYDYDDSESIYYDAETDLSPLCYETSKNTRVISFLLQKCPDLQKLFALIPKLNEESKGEFEFESFKNKNIIVKGFVQSGKTNFIISTSALFNIIGNKNIVIITRNSTDDELQLKNRLNYFDNEMKNISVEFINEKIKSVFIDIGHPRRIKNLLKTLSKTQKEYVLFIDEVDFMDSIDTKTTEQLSKLKEKAYCIFDVSATVMDPILKTEETNLIILSKPENYRGIESFVINTLPNKSLYLIKKISNPIIEDNNLENYLNDFSTREPYFVPIYNEYHPVDTLIRVSKAIDANKRLLCYIANKFLTIPCMFYSGRGSIELYLPNIKVPIELADGNKSKIIKLQTETKLERLAGTYHSFSKTSPSYIKQWLYENGGVSIYPRIITLAGDLASRCISYGASNFEQCKKENKLWWHLTEMYLCASSSMDQPELIQTAGRLCVATPRGDNVPLTLYTTKEVEKDLVKAYWLQEELIDRANRQYSETSPLWRLIQEIPIYNGKIPTKKRSLTKKMNYELNDVITKDDGGYEFELYENKEQEMDSDTIDIQGLTKRRKEVVILLYNSVNKIQDDWILASTFYRNKTGDQQAICNILKDKTNVRIKVNNDFLFIRKLEGKNRYQFRIENSN